MHAIIAGRDGETAHVVTLVPAPGTARSPSGKTQPYLHTSQMLPFELRPLTDAQLDRLPELTARLHEIVPLHQQPHVDDLARRIAQDIPARTDLLRAYQRTSVTEVLSEFAARTAPGTGNTAAAIKTARLNFPAHPRTAVKHPPGQQASTAPGHPASRKPDHGIGR